MSPYLSVMLTLVLLSSVDAADQEALALPRGAATIRGKVGDSEIVVTTTERLAGAIHSLTWKGKEFIDSTDHGRQLQSASNLDCGTRMFGETFNPTEAGSRRDGAGPRSSSRLLHLIEAGSTLQTTTQMAFWLNPGEKSGGHPAKNKTIVSNHLLTKRVQIGLPDLPNVVIHDACFTLPVGEHHTYAQFEAITGYMPAEFRKFWTFDVASGKLQPLSDGPGEQKLPVVFTTEDGSYAMGVYSPQQPSSGFEHAGYGRFRFEAQKVVKWNCVFRVRNKDGVPAGEYSYRSYIPVGSREMVVRSLQQLCMRFGKTE